MESLAKRFTAQPAPTIVALIRDATEPLDKTGIVQLLGEAGVPAATAEKKWVTAQKLFRQHPHIRLVKRRYDWSADPIPAEDALSLLLKPAVPQWLKDALADAVRAGLTTGSGQAGTALQAAQERQWRIDIVRAVAEVAIEVEEIAYNGADPDLIVERVRTRALLQSLTPIGQAGDETTYDPSHHNPLTGSPAAGSAVFIVRPGYTWRTGVEDVLIERAVVSTT